MTSSAPDTDAAPGYHGSAGSLFWLMFRTTVYNLLTLGIYRFWQRTKMRQHFWNGIRVRGSALEYTGTGLEKLLGFLIAVVFLAFYLGLFQIGFFFLGLQLSGGSELVGLFSSLPIVPLIYYAQYRSRRYILSRTQLRGIRFSMSQDAFAYVLHALGHLLLTVLTLGILYPRMQWHLERFKTNRTSYGDLRMLQGGRWQSLMRPWLWVLATLILPLVLSGVLALSDHRVGAVIVLFALLAAPLAWVNYSVASFRILTNSKSAGGMAFTSHARTGTVIAIYLLGYLLIGVIIWVAGLTLMTAAAVITGEALSGFGDIEGIGDILRFTSFWVIAVGYLAIFLMWSALNTVFIAQPLLAHYVSTLTIHDADHLDAVRQRAQDDFVEAEGFADALDVGGAF